VAEIQMSRLSIHASVSFVLEFGPSARQVVYCLGFCCASWRLDLPHLVMSLSHPGMRSTLFDRREARPLTTVAMEHRSNGARKTFRIAL
jgi:hypothetical protein